MTYGMFKELASGLLAGDTTLPSKPDAIQALTNYALTTVAMKADSLHLMTLSTTANILRLSQGDYMIRVPIVPDTDSDVLDIDEELVFPAARLLASYVSREKGGIHVQAANRAILDYNAKTWEILDQMELEAAQEGVADLCYSAPDSEWTL